MRRATAQPMTDRCGSCTAAVGHRQEIRQICARRRLASRPHELGLHVPDRLHDIHKAVHRGDQRFLPLPSLSIPANSIVLALSFATGHLPAGPQFSLSIPLTLMRTRASGLSDHVVIYQRLMVFAPRKRSQAIRCQHEQNISGPRRCLSRHESRPASRPRPQLIRLPVAACARHDALVAAIR